MYFHQVSTLIWVCELLFVKFWIVIIIFRFGLGEEQFFGFIRVFGLKLGKEGSKEKKIFMTYDG